MTPEQLARIEIDRLLIEAGWVVQDHRSMNIRANLGVAVREFPLDTGPVDYLLYADGKVIGVVEAKPEGHTLVGVELQSRKYLMGIPAGLPVHHRPVAFAYETTGTVTQFSNALEPDYRSREVFTFHRPEELLRLVRQEKQLRGLLREFPAIDPTRLWSVQHVAIANLERSLAANRPRALIQMATGSGKTYTACSAIYRLLRFAGAKRILFLVDRNNLGRQTLNEFQQYVSPYNGLKFTEEYNVQRLKHNTIDPASKVVVTTIQRLYSMLKGEEDYLDENEEGSLFEAEQTLTKEPVPVVYNPMIPIESFDFIVIDECHRSIYNVWRQVLEYFDAFLIGLTATPTAQTVGFFHGNVVQDYSHEKAVIDGVNVGYDVFRIATKISEQGATLQGKPEFYVPTRDRRTGEKKLKELDNDLTYTANQLNLDVVNLSQLRLVIKTFKERLSSEIFPGRNEVPKTLVFAKTDLHADDVVKIIREEFSKGNEFCVKITSKTTGRKPEDLLAEFRNSYFPRIAVTVDMIATGTDVKAIECLLFLRNISSAAYFEQMKGRGCRIIPDSDLKTVTPDANHKERFVIVDAVGVCERDKTHSRPLDRKPTVPLKSLLQMAAQGQVFDDLVSALGSRLARLAGRLSAEQHADVTKASGGQNLNEIAGKLIASLDPDINAQQARTQFNIAPEAEPTEEQLSKVEQAAMEAALKPFFQPDFRDLLLNIEATLSQVLDEVTADTLIADKTGFSAAAKEKAQSLVQDFKAFVESNKEQIEAIKLLYSQPYRSGLRYRQVRDLANKLSVSPFNIDPKHPESVGKLWTAYMAAEPESVKGKEGGKALVDLIALVRHAIHPLEPVVSVRDKVEENYREWLAKKESAGIVLTLEQRAWLDAIKDHIATSLAIEQDDFESPPFNQMGGLGKVYQLFGEQLPVIIAELNERLAA